MVFGWVAAFGFFLAVETRGESTCSTDIPLCGAADLPWREVVAAAVQWTEKPRGIGRHLHVVMQVTEPIGAYSRFSVASTAIWARSHGHTLSIHGELPGGTAAHPTPTNMDPRYGKVELLRQHATSCPAEWLLWLDSDVSITVRNDWATEVSCYHSRVESNWDYWQLCVVCLTGR